MAKPLDGKQLAAEIRALLAERIATREEKPGLRLFRVGEDPASVVYVRNKEKSSLEVGIRSEVVVLPEQTTESDLLTRIAESNADPSVDGILVQLPLPGQIRSEAVMEAIDPGKDVDGLTPANQGALTLARPNLVPCTPLGVVALLNRNGVEVAGRHVVVLGRSSIVGRPLSVLLSLKAPWADATVTVAHSRSRNLDGLCREADILVAAMGQPMAVKANWIKPGSAVVDVGIHRIDDPSRPSGSRLCGDVDAAGVSDVAGWLSPVPGGVGPLTVVMLLANTLLAFERRRGLPARPIWEDAIAAGRA
ncbi:MAG: bifunctional 5,10-methylenetetrahydrofolate dehydrogenase/5,10-methenyltetrahydrofolate cyclohydrolase [Candidatus Eisenbacteria bacterium]|nr:bifunctional 5,10-methylenetetrahydrofolate dehydrogenase/5,10-methenyltetrahydrofolate cyclohydrolase [Candidatus Eisenbacteria bacterium]